MKTPALLSLASVLGSLAVLCVSLPAQTTTTPITSPPIDFPQPFPVGNHVDATTSIILRALTGVYAPPPPPSSITVLPGTIVKISTPVPDTKIASITWYKDNRKLSVSTPTLTLPAASRDDEGFYSAHVTRTDEPPIRVIYEGTFETLRLRVGTAEDRKFLNLSSRTTLSPTNPALISGFVVAASLHDPFTGKKVLFRAVGPSLTKLGVRSPLAHPKLKIFNADGSEYGGMYAWIPEGAPTWTQFVNDATSRTGAFPLLAGAADAVDVRPMPPGVYTVHVTSTDAGTGDVLLEIYEVPDDPNPPSVDLPPVDLPPVAPSRQAASPR